ncbi:MAG: T9SS C-terminal target domain-containing protein [Bacteroidota bacterium]
MRKFIILGAACTILLTPLSAQRKFEVHTRGMLHQTIYNTGELGRAYDQGTVGVQSSVPSFEWPGNSSLVVDSKEYTGQHNSFGGGLQMSLNRRDTTRMYVYCGGASSVPVYGVYSFPLSLTRTENYPVLSDGNLNSSYNPNEAEEVIVTSWATPAGITVTRTSRAWSMPDFDDFIIYEYELENTGDTDGNAGTPARQDTLTEILVSFSHGLAPGKTGHERKYNRWNGGDFQQTDTYARFDRRRWMNYTMNDDGLPDPVYSTQWAQTGTNGGGLQAPMAVGYMVLHYDTTRLARRTETQTSVSPTLAPIVWDANDHLKQPYLNRLETSLWTEAKYITNMNPAQYPRSGNSPYSNVAVFGTDWVGRSSFNVRQSWVFGVGRQIVFGPYILKPGEKIRFSIAEVAGFGAASPQEAQAGLMDEGGSCGQACNESASLNAFNPVASYYDTVRYGGDQRLHGSTYLRSYTLPPYVNSNVVTIRDVADRAIEVYTGASSVVDFDSSQFWPERAPDHGVYAIPLIVPAPGITIVSTARAQNKIEWGNQIEGFASPRLLAPFSHYVLLKSSHPLGPWTTVDSIAKSDPRYFNNGTYAVIDTSTRVLESHYYAVVSVDANGNRSGLTNLALFQTQLGGTETLEPVYVVPNPFIVQSGFTGANNPENKIGFYNLPKECLIRIISYSGQLVETINHNSGMYSTEYFRVTRNNQVIASGVYFYVVETPDGRRIHGKFVVIQ